MSETSLERDLARAERRIRELEAASMSAGPAFAKIMRGYDEEIGKLRSERAALAAKLAEVEMERDVWKASASERLVALKRVEGILCDASTVATDAPDGVAQLVQERDAAIARAERAEEAVRFLDQWEHDVLMMALRATDRAEEAEAIANAALREGLGECERLRGWNDDAHRLARIIDADGVDDATLAAVQAEAEAAYERTGVDGYLSVAEGARFLRTTDEDREAQRREDEAIEMRAALLRLGRAHLADLEALRRLNIDGAEAASAWFASQPERSEQGALDAVYALADRLAEEGE